MNELNLHTRCEISGISLLSWKIQNWIRQEIVDDDPCDEETFFLQSNRFGEEDALQLNLEIGKLTNSRDFP
jgi:hypothetical protein